MGAPRARGYERGDLLLHRRLAEAVQEWEDRAAREDYLPREGRLAQFESWAAATDIGITEGEREYWPRAAAARTSAAGEPAAARAVLAAPSPQPPGGARRGRAGEPRACQDQEALATSRELAASSIAVLDRDPELSVLLALEAAEAAEPT